MVAYEGFHVRDLLDKTGDFPDPPVPPRAFAIPIESTIAQWARSPGFIDQGGVPFAGALTFPPHAEPTAERPGARWLLVADSVLALYGQTYGYTTP